MKVLLFGGGNIGGAIAAELLSRGHTVTQVTRSGGGDPKASTVVGTVTDAENVAQLAAGHDAVVSAVGGRDQRGLYAAAAVALTEGLRRAGVRRLVVVGGAGSLEVAPGVQAVDSDGFPEVFKPDALAQRNALQLYRAVSDLEWTYVSPAGEIGPGERTGVYRLGGDQMLTDADGRSRISYADYAVALVDELERGKAIRRRITAAY